MRKTLKQLCVLALGSLAFSAVLATDAKWPERPVKLIVPFTPGGVTDNASRLLAKLLEPHLGQPVVVENRPGAGGSIGVEAAARQAAETDYCWERQAPRLTALVRTALASPASPRA